MLSTSFPNHFVEEMLRKTFKNCPFVPVVTQLKSCLEPKKWTSIENLVQQFFFVDSMNSVEMSDFQSKGAPLA